MFKSATKSLISASSLRLRLLLSSPNSITSSSSSAFKLFSTSSSIFSTSTNSTIPLPSTTTKEPKLLSYFIKRSSGGSLPVYAELKEGGARTFTIIRKIDGSLEAFAQDLKKHFPTAITRIKPQARQVVITGDWVKETKEYLSAGGF